MFKIFKKKKKIGCPVCHENNTVGFGSDYLESNFESKIVQVDKIGNFSIFKCSICFSDFFKEGEMYQKFADGQIGLLKQFDESDLILSEKIKQELEQIGLVPDWNLNNLAPGKIKLKNGEIYDFATIQISINPPIGYYYSQFKKIIFIDDVESVKPSNYGLSEEIREKTRNVEEMRMGFYPTVLKTNCGKRIVINGQPIFFKKDEIKGADLILAHENWNHKEKYKCEDKIENQILVIAKK